MATSSSCGLVMWDLATGKVLSAWQAHEGHINVVQKLPVEDLLLTGGEDGIIRVWRVPGPHEMQFWTPPEEEVSTTDTKSGIKRSADGSLDSADRGAGARGCQASSDHWPTVCPALGGDGSREDAVAGGSVAVGQPSILGDNEAHDDDDRNSTEASSHRQTNQRRETYFRPPAGEDYEEEQLQRRQQKQHRRRNERHVEGYDVDPFVTGEEEIHQHSSSSRPGVRGDEYFEASPDDDLDSPPPMLTALPPANGDDGIDFSSSYDNPDLPSPPKFSCPVAPEIPVIEAEHAAGTGAVLGNDIADELDSPSPTSPTRIGGGTGLATVSTSAAPSPSRIKSAGGSAKAGGGNDATNSRKAFSTGLVIKGLFVGQESDDDTDDFKDDLRSAFH